LREAGALISLPERSGSGRRAWRPRTTGANQLVQLAEQGRGLRGRQRLDRLAEAVGVGSGQTTRGVSPADYRRARLKPVAALIRRSRRSRCTPRPSRRPRSCWSASSRRRASSAGARRHHRPRWSGSCAASKTGMANMAGKRGNGEGSAYQRTDGKRCAAITQSQAGRRPQSAHGRSPPRRATDGARL
jgi:hypothetical protein